MREEHDEQRCLDCGEAMQRGSAVTADGHQSNWWRCTNARCGAEWLLPARPPTKEPI